MIHIGGITFVLRRCAPLPVQPKRCAAPWCTCTHGACCTVCYPTSFSSSHILPVPLA